MNTDFLTRAITIPAWMHPVTNTEDHNTKWFGYATREEYEKAKPYTLELLPQTDSRWSEKQLLRFASQEEALAAARRYSKQQGIRIGEIK